MVTKIEAEASQAYQTLIKNLETDPQRVLNAIREMGPSCFGIQVETEHDVSPSSEEQLLGAKKVFDWINRYFEPVQAH